MNKRRKKTLANIVILLLIVGGIVWIASVFVHIGGEYTDNAQVEQNLVNVNARVQGFAERIYVDEYCPVRRGDTLMTIEDSEFRLHLAQAEAGLQNALAGKAASEKSVSGAANNIAVTEAGIDEVNVLLANAEADYMRYKALFEKDAVTKQQYDAVRTQYESLKAKAETMRRQRTGSGLTRDEHSIRVGQQDAAIDVARAALNLARLNMSYCTVLAPCDGSTSRKLVQEGELVQPGMRLFSIVDDRSRWVVANFRETQLKGIKKGSKVEITVDAMKGITFYGIVANISTATGAQYSPVAPDNSTGNFVKVEQRIPVKITFTDDNDKDLLAQLTAGMNVECKVLK
ncbi:MAG: HlyD family secretion protein [Prevotella sp.]|nr:HlyD family secretion protein [Prevotella sp.]